MSDCLASQELEQIVRTHLYQWHVWMSWDNTSASAPGRLHYRENARRSSWQFSSDPLFPVFIWHISQRCPTAGVELAQWRRGDAMESGWAGRVSAPLSAGAAEWERRWGPLNLGRDTRRPAVTVPRPPTAPTGARSAARRKGATGRCGGCLGVVSTRSAICFLPLCEAAVDSCSHSNTTSGKDEANLPLFVIKILHRLYWDAYISAWAFDARLWYISNLHVFKLILFWFFGARPFGFGSCICRKCLLKKK